MPSNWTPLHYTWQTRDWYGQTVHDHCYHVHREECNNFSSMYTGGNRGETTGIILRQRGSFCPSSYCSRAPLFWTPLFFFFFFFLFCYLTAVDKCTHTNTDFNSLCITIAIYMQASFEQPYMMKAYTDFKYSRLFSHLHKPKLTCRANFHSQFAV